MTAVPVDAEFEVHPAITDPRLRALVRPELTQWTPRELRDLTSTVAAELTPGLLEVLHYGHSSRWWTRLALTEGVELWLLSWLPGQGTGPHDHGGAAGSFTVLLGELSEEYRYPAGPIRSLNHFVGGAIGFGAGRAHVLRNDSVAPAASVHAYSPPLVATREYESLLDVPSTIPALIPEPRA
ncbi:MAG TPA: cysteine dioxygenase family protein [Pseudonocardiaceae bacterium]|nr:cysteine dioxygenase family protein [Pseudonocardiaceae bacterium]